LSTTYKILAGDTFEIIARKEYGTELKASLISNANPGIVEPLSAGTTLTIPVDPIAPTDKIQDAPADNEDEVAILIDGVRFRFWDKVTINRTVDAMDMVNFTAPFDGDEPAFRETFRPFAYKPVVITLGGTVLFTGTMVSPVPSIAERRKILSVSCYSSPGVLGDCPPPASIKNLEQLEFNEQTLKAIATSLAALFGIGVQFDSSPGPVFDRVAIKSTRKVLEFLIELAKQRNLIVTSSNEGALLFKQGAVPGNPVATLLQGSAPVLTVTPNFDPQNFYSHVTAVAPASLGVTGEPFTVKNPHLDGVLRPFTFTVPDTIEGGTKAAAESKAGRMFAGMVTYDVAVSTWRDAAGDLWEPGTTLRLHAHDAMIYSNYEFEIRSVAFSREPDSKTTVLTLIIPGALAGKIPEALPWDEDE